MARETAPAFQFYPKDFLSDSRVLAMTLPELGAYIRLLCVCWLEKSLPSEPKALARICRVSPSKFTKLWPAISQCFSNKNGVLVQPRMEREREKQCTYRELKAKAGSKGGRTTAERKQAASKGLAKSSPPSSSSSPSSSSEVRTSADADFETFRQAYPVKGRVGGPRAKAAFAKAKKTATSEQLLSALDQHKRSAQWQAPKFIPGMLVWLHQERWRQVLPEPQDVALTKAERDRAIEIRRKVGSCIHDPPCADYESCLRAIAQGRT